ncbi:hypothetical protein Tco_1408417, partial [Tanacetum coccineum]
MTTNQTTSNSIRSILKKDKLNGSNSLDWYCNLRIVLGYEQKLNHLNEALPEAPLAIVAIRNAYTRRELKTMFQHHAEEEYFETVKACHACKQEKGQSVSTYVLKGLMEVRLNKGVLDLCVGNGNRTAAEAMGSFGLILPNGMVLVL